ncbi:hypothetical protein GWI33_014478 [Rhynchophorus ferrugineus]|uniref:Uncharacterized protein n=1 Tax=Rhynchophorus ferrugineus TaxID=354439 RepID=A0A834I2J5_RHYFE|nr:hypothetical protein GWI33_014478 [Rhynchophorus ferrugineus]
MVDRKNVRHPRRPYPEAVNQFNNKKVIPYLKPEPARLLLEVRDRGATFPALFRNLLKVVKRQETLGVRTICLSSSPTLTVRTRPREDRVANIVWFFANL